MHYSRKETEIMIATLSEAINLLQRGWCRGTLARDKSNRCISLYSTDACKFCAEGSILKANTITKNYLDIIGYIGINYTHDGCLAEFNDKSSSKKKVIKLFEKVKQDLQKGLIDNQHV